MLTVQMKLSTQPRGMPALGNLFASPRAYDPRAYAEGFGEGVFNHYGYAGRETDAAVMLDDGRWAPVEEKTASAHVE